MTMPQQGGQPDTCCEVPMAEGGAVSVNDIGAACEMAVDAAVSQRQSTGRDAGL